MTSQCPKWGKMGQNEAKTISHGWAVFCDWIWGRNSVWIWSKNGQKLDWKMVLAPSWVAWHRICQLKTPRVYIMGGVYNTNLTPCKHGRKFFTWKKIVRFGFCVRSEKSMVRRSFFFVLLRRIWAGRPLCTTLVVKCWRESVAARYAAKKISAMPFLGIQGQKHIVVVEANLRSPFSHPIF
jgi:hypothetical protein